MSRIHSPPVAGRSQKFPEVTGPVIGLYFFIAAEIMFFAGLLSAYWILRAQPPAGQPRYPVLVTAINTGVLLFSGYAIFRPGRLWLFVTAAAGTLFLAIQGYEWLRLIHFGLTTFQNIYGGLFYLIVGVHALHLLAALLYLLVVMIRRTVAIEPCRIYWTFVVLLWPVIYVTLYLL